jgi:hypothetical protein
MLPAQQEELLDVIVHGPAIWKPGSRGKVQLRAGTGQAHPEGR